MKKQFDQYILQQVKDGKPISGLESLFVQWVAENTTEVLRLFEQQAKDIKTLEMTLDELTGKYNAKVGVEDQGEKINKLISEVEYWRSRHEAMIAKLEEAQLNFSLACRTFHKHSGLHFDRLIKGQGLISEQSASALIITP